MGLPTWLFSKSKIKPSQLKKNLFNFIKIALNSLSHFTLQFTGNYFLKLFLLTLAIKIALNYPYPDFVC